MSYLEVLEADRRKKLIRVRELGQDPFGSPSLSRPQSIEDILYWYRGVNDESIPVKDRWVFEGREEQLASCTLRGRVVTKNNRGKLKFFFLRDSTSEIQLMFSKADFEDEATWELVSLIDVLDHVEVHGKVKATQTGEITLAVDRFQFMGKSIAPPPEKFHGIQDEETLVRQRYMAFIQDSTLRDKIITRSKIMSTVRSQMNALDYVEVETPILSVHSNGATARPFKTHHNSLGEDLDLRIAPELDLKRMLVGGFDRVYELGKVFRNEGIDPTHNPEFTILECYEAYADAERMMEVCEKVIRECSEAVRGPGQTNVHVLGSEPFRRMRMEDLFARLGVDLFNESSVLSACKDRGVYVEDYAAAVDKVLDAALLCQIGYPLLVTGYPAAVCPLARRSSSDPRIADRFELYVFTSSGVMELANGYSELNDPDEQLANFKDQAHGKVAELVTAARKIENNPEWNLRPHEWEHNIEIRIDHDYVNALKVGMPMAGGLGIGIDRLVMLLTNSESIRDVIAFPLVKRKKD